MLVVTYSVTYLGFEFLGRVCVDLEPGVGRGYGLRRGVGSLSAEQWVCSIT